jgi:hypothetical protein
MDDDILAQELGKLGELGSKMGGVLSGMEKLTGTAVSVGVQVVAKFLPTESFSLQFSMEVPADKALKLGFFVLSKLGEMQKKDVEDAPYPYLKAVIRSGFFGMNPAVVYFEILQGDASACTVTIAGAAKEGLIKQKTAEKAVHKVTAHLREAIAQRVI